jgi:hypothetical protein
MGRRKKVAASQVSVSLDFGGSGLKAIAANEQGKSLVIYMEPEVIEASAESLKEKTKSLAHAYPENLAWVGVGEDYRAVGYLAASRYYANAGLSKKKYTLALYRTLAALWAIAYKFDLPLSLTVRLGVLLPPGEFEDSALLLDELLKALKEFDTPTGKMSVKLLDFVCYPEGAGVYLMHCRQAGEAIKRSVSAVIMVGYRNASILISRRGAIDNGRTIDLGMARLVELVQQKTSALKTAPLLKAIAASGEQPQVKHFLGLTEVGGSPQARRTEAEKIVEAVINARAEYLRALGSWLAEVLPLQELDEVVFCGGTTDYLKTQLDSYFPATPVKWHGGFEMPSDWGQQGLGNRLADVYGLSLALQDRSEG